MKRILIHCLIVLLFTITTMFVFNIKQTLAVYDPLSVPNNKIGIHILFVDELAKARELINSSGGDWGYVTIPIQAGDRDLKKWQTFMDDCRKFHIIPIIRLATEGDYFEKAAWRKAEDTDVVDFANFLNSLSWPVKNRYIIVFNEVNRADEWEGQANPSEYAEILSYAVTVFKSKNQDFFMISGGMDNAAATDGKNYSQYDYYRIMNQSVPGIFNQIDGFSSHAYPNPAFSQPPSVDTPRSINSFSYELATIEAMSVKKLPVFITETGWDQKAISEKTAASYYKEALNGYWNNSSIVAITPFLLTSGSGPFEKFSFLKSNGDKNETFKMIESLPKIKGAPSLTTLKKILGEETNLDIPVKNFSNQENEDKGKNVKQIIKWIFLGI